MSYKHLTLNDRNKIEVSNKEGYSSRRISKVLGFHHSTIARELKRCKSEYKAKSTKEYISISTYKSHGKYSQTAIQSHFGTWKKALLEAGFRCERTPVELKMIPDEEYYRDLRRVAKILNLQTVPYVEYKELGKYSVEHIFKRFENGV